VIKSTTATKTKVQMIRHELLGANIFGALGSFAMAALGARTNSRVFYYRMGLLT
jgi:hypothetical protein